MLAVAMLAAACSSAPTAAAVQRRALQARYLAIATLGNQGLEKAFDGLDGPDRNDLVAARADLRGAAAAETEFDRSLLAIAFPSAIEATARAVVKVNATRAALTAEAAGSVTLRQLRAYAARLRAANDAVVQQVTILRAQLGLPPPETS